MLLKKAINNSGSFIAITIRCSVATSAFIKAGVK